jgi:hypothetical protein
MVNVKTQPVDWEAFLAGFAGGENRPGPTLQLPLNNWGEQF